MKPNQVKEGPRAPRMDGEVVFRHEMRVSAPMRRTLKSSAGLSETLPELLRRSRAIHEQLQNSYSRLDSLLQSQPGSNSAARPG